jgi:polyferredoxin
VRARHLVWLRRGTQALFLSLFLLFLVESRLPQDIYADYSLAFSGDQDLRPGWPVTFFFHLDPLVGITSLLSGYRWINGLLWGVGVLLLALLMGRVFCGFVCPFGTIHHAVSWTRPALKGARMVQANLKTSSQRVKYFLLILILAAALLGLNLSGLLDPIALLFRSIALAVVPAIGAAMRSGFDAMAASDIKILKMLSYGAEIVLAPIFGYSTPAFQTAWFIGLLFLGIVVLNRIRPRF